MTDQHKHCPVCQKPMPLSEKTCSPKCEEVYMENQRKIAKSRRYLYVVFIIFVLIFLYVTLKSKLGL